MRGRRAAPVLRRGTALIETMIALVILALTAAGMISLLAQTITGMHDLHSREREMSAATAALERASSWTRAELLAHVGVRREPALWLDVERSGTSLFDVVVRDTLHRVELLRTTVYRADSLP